jgi:hypothetical protein
LELEAASHAGVGDSAPKSRIRSLGLASAQGSARDVRARTSFDPPRALPWPEKRWTTSRYCRPAADVFELEGARRWNALARRALEECFGTLPADPPPIVVASCNGADSECGTDGWLAAFDSGELLKGTPWQGTPVPVVSASCTSGLQALYLAQHILAAGTNEVVVLAVDILSPRSQDNFESLHVLSSSPRPPWLPPAGGFVTGEAAVAILLEQGSHEDGRPWVSGVSLDHDLDAGDGLSRVVSGQSHRAPGVVLGQGTGPESIDGLELEALSRFVARDVPVASALSAFGHTLGASGVLSLALAALAYGHPRPIPTGNDAGDSTSDGRPVGHQLRGDGALILSRALTGACAAVYLGAFSSPSLRRTDSASLPGPPPECVLPVTRRLAADLASMRPSKLPDVLIVRLHAPLCPTPTVHLGGRLLPSAILEITPGFLLSLVVRLWEYTGPSLCLVANERCDAVVEEWLRALCASGLRPGVVTVSGRGDERSVQWSS